MWGFLFNFTFMIKGKTHITKHYLSADEILEKTNGGYDIYRYYLGKVERIRDRPWGRKEKKPSWGIYPSTVWLWKDQATEETGNALTFVERYFGLSSKEARDKVCWDFGLSSTEVPNVNPVKITWTPPPEEEREYMDINFSRKPFSPKHHAFWNAAEVDEAHCNKYNCFAVKDLAINRKRVSIGKDEIVFAYYCPEEDSAKIYFPERDKDKKFRNNVSYRYLWNYENIQECENLIIQKSCKDLIVTTLLTPCVIATQAEAVKIFDEETVAKVNKVSKSPWVWYGSDGDGVKKCQAITGTNKWKYINTPKKFLPDVNDAYSFVKAFGLKVLEDFMKHKKLLK